MVPASLVDTMKWREIKNKKMHRSYGCTGERGNGGPLSPKAPERLEPTA
jgi:hypothetical protein